MYTEKSIKCFCENFEDIEDNNFFAGLLLLGLFTLTMLSWLASLIKGSVDIKIVIATGLIYITLLNYYYNKMNLEPEKIDKITEYNWCQESKDILIKCVKEKKVLKIGAYKKAYSKQIDFLRKKIEEQKYINSQKIFNN